MGQMRSPYRKGVQVTVSNAAVQAAATMIAQAYRGGSAQGPQRILNLASEIVDEIEARAKEEPAIDPMLEMIEIPAAA